MTINAEPEPLYVDNVTVKHVSGHKYLISVSGNAPTPGYSNIRLVPRTYMAAPESWEIDVVAEPPSGGMVIQMLKPYNVSLEHTFSKGVKSITVVGRAHQVKANLTKGKKKEKKGTLEILYGIKVEKNSVVFKVMSTGCTKKKDFVVRVEKKKTVVVAGLYRVKPDICEEKPHIVEIEFTREELGLGEAKKKNKMNIELPNFKIKNQFSFGF